MAGRSEMSPEDRIRGSDIVLVDLQVANVGRIKADAEQCSTAQMNTLIGGSGLSSRRVSGALAASRKGVADVAKAAAVKALKALAANENDIDANAETEMDDDSGRTPERVEQVRAEIQRRLALVGGDRESKSVDGPGAMVGGGTLPGDLARAGEAPEGAG
jgi:hypothetical protein